MRKLFIIQICLLVYFILNAVSISRIHADFASDIQSTQVAATIGEYYISLAGFIAPNASVVLISNNVILRSAVADSNGYFYITGVLINKGFSDFCLDAIDFKRLGESYTCFSVPPAQQNITEDNIFLPPTLGLQHVEITAGQDAIAWGYSMPNSLVTIHSSEGKTYVVSADNTGYYEINFKIANAGKYELFADATYQNKQSKTPDRKITLTALSSSQQALKHGTQAANNFWRFLIGSAWGELFIILLLLIIIIFLLKKLRPDWFTFTNFSSYFKQPTLANPSNLLHHAWFVGY